MPKTGKVIGAKEFKERVTAKLKSIDSKIQEDLKFSCMPSGFYLEYRPEQPEKGNQDFIVHQGLNSSITVDSYNRKTGEITLDFYENIEDFEKRFCVS